MDDFYFAYDFDGKSASRLYRFINGQFERYDPGAGNWKPSPEQACIFVGEDGFYDEISEEQANSIQVTI
ncbi:hypothetical protein [Paenibacillus koleovorans]|uniref:hypothetical protein n=1 Tax=Paenibacillus koleovorans TaxID=121608 RepID=UPI000FDA52A4|nr:hypothetical protein [Paenibacillus koleovorans]